MPLVVVSGPGSRYYAPAEESGDWADTFVTFDGIGPALATDGLVVGIRGTTAAEYGAFASEGNGGSLEFESGTAYGGEDSIKLIPPDVGPEPAYCSILYNANITNGGVKEIAQINIRFIAELGSRYIDLASGTKWLSCHVGTAPNASSSNRACLFEGYEPSAVAAGRIYAVTADETQSYHQPRITDPEACYHPDCGTAAQKGFLVRSTADHGGTPAVAGPNEQIYFEMELDVRRDRGNADGRNRMYVATRDGVIDKYMEIPLTWEGAWNFAWNCIINIEGLGWYWNTPGTAHADNWIKFSRIALSVNRAVDNPIGKPPGFFT